jgi:hypothetical protein
MCGSRGPRVIQQNITSKQPGGFGGFMMGLFGGYSGCYPMPTYGGFIPFTNAVPYRDQAQFMFYAQQMQIQNQFAMMNQAQSQYAYLNQMQQMPMLQQAQQQLLPGSSDADTSSTEMKNLETFFKDKGYIICPEADGKFTVADKDGNLLASGTYAEVRDKLFEINKAEAEEAEEESDVDDADDADDADDDDAEVSSTRTQKMPSNWYTATADGNKNVKNIDTNKVIAGAKKEGQSAARYIVGHNILGSKYYGGLSAKQINALTSEFIHYNQDCFNKDGSLKEGFDVSKLAVPTSSWIAKYIIGNEAMTPNAAVRAAKTHVTKNGNIQYHANIMAQYNFRETLCKDVFYNDKTKVHMFFFADSMKMVPLTGVKQVNANGNWIDSNGKTHSKDELIALAEKKLEDMDAGQHHDNNGEVPDNDGRTDTTHLWNADEE